MKLRTPLLTIAGMILMTPLLAPAQVERGTWELTLAGVGTSSNDFDQSAIGVSGGLGYYVLDSLELTLRQTVTYVHTPDEDLTNASSILALDVNIPLGFDHRIVPFVGGNAGYFYGDAISDSFEYAPEAGVKYYVNSTTFVFGRVEYQFFEHGAGGSSDSSDEQWLFTVGIGFRF